MRDLVIADPNYPSQIVPPVAAMQDRGSTLFDDRLTGTGTASTVTKAITYCKDIRGCGEADYRSVVAGTTLNFLENCVPRLNGVMTISGLFFNQADADQLNDMIALIRAATGGGFDAAAVNVCGTIN